MKLVLSGLLALSVASAFLPFNPHVTAQHASQAEIEAADLATKLAAIEKFTEEKRVELGVPGAALVIVKDDKVVLMKGFGHRDLERRLPVTPDTLFDTQSVTKTFTGLAVMMSVDEGKLSLDDSPKKFLPFLKFRDPVTDARVTVRDLLTHRTGLFNANYTWMTRGLNRTDLLKVVSLAKPTGKLGQQLIYNNAMYSLVGEVVAKAQNSTYERVVTSRILKPLKMRASNLSVNEMQKSPDFAYGYEFTEVPGGVRRFPMIDYSSIAAAGALNSNARDLGQYLRFMLGGGVIDGKRLLSEKSFKELLSPQFKLSPTGYWAVAWSSRGYWNGHRIFFHGGAQEGYNNYIAIMPDQKLGYALLTNISVSPLARGVVDEVIWTTLVGKREPAPPSGGNPASTPSALSQTSSSFVSPLSADELLSKMVEAAGGEANLRKHKSSEATGSYDYEQQGITGEGVVHWEAPNFWSRSITLSALNKKLGTSHEYFDGNSGGIESTFLPLRLVTGDQLNDLRVATDFNPLLNWKTQFKSITIKGISKIGDEDAFIVVKTPTQGSPVTDYVSTKSFLLLRRETMNGVVENFSDYRMVDGTMTPFKVERNIPGVGNVVVHLKSIKFNVPMPASKFRTEKLFRS